MPQKVEDALAREIQFAAALADTARAIVVVLDREGRITHGNAFLADLGGFESADDLVGLDWFETFLPERERAHIRELYQAVLRGELVQPYENPVLDGHGREHQIEWTWRLLLDDSGGVLGVLSVGLDISKAQTVERQLEHQQARLASVIEGTQDAFIFIDHRARILAFNPSAERIFGYQASEAVGNKVEMLMPEPYRSEHDGYIHRYEQTGEARAIGRIRVVQGQRKDGEVFPIELSVTKVGPDDEARYAAFIRDVSETTKLRERLLERERLAAIGTTSAKFAHEVGNPLNGMMMNLQLIQRRIDKEAPIEKISPLVERVENEVRRLATLLEEFRGMSRRQSFMFSLVQASTVLEEFATSHRESYASMGVTLEVEWDEDLPPFHADRLKFTQVLLNLAKNGAEAMADKDGGTLVIRARRGEEGVLIEVQDTGGGIPEGVDVFEPFVTTKSKGTGLGLPVVRQIVAGHGGELTYDSRVGEGTTFRISLPVDPPSASSFSLRKAEW